MGPNESNDPFKTELSLAGGKEEAEGDLKEIPGMRTCHAIAGSEK